MSHIYKKEKCRSKKKEMWKHEKKKCRRQVNLIVRAKIWKRYKSSLSRHSFFKMGHTAFLRSKQFFSNTFNIHRSGIGGYSLCQTFCMLVPSIQKSPIRFRNPMELNNSHAASAFFTFLPFYFFTF